MRIGIIAPTKLIQKYCITPLQYYLPHLLLESRDYLEAYKEKRLKGSSLYLDCRGPEQLRTPIKKEALEEAIKLLKPDYIILPSKAFNLKASLEIQKTSRELLKHYRTIPCLEGTSPTEVETFLKVYPKTLIAIPSHMYIVTRTMQEPPRGIFIENRNEPYELPKGPGILFTSMPVRLGLEGKLNSLAPTTSHVLDFNSEDRYEKVVEKNIQDLLEYYSEEE